MEDKKERYRYRYCEFATKLIESLSEKLLQIIAFNPDILDLVTDQEASLKYVKKFDKLSKAMKLMESNGLVPKPFLAAATTHLNDTLQRLYASSQENSSAYGSLAVTPIVELGAENHKSRFIEKTKEKQIDLL